MWKTILVPHDFSQAAGEAATLARDEAEQHGGRVVLLHVLDASPALVPETVFDDAGAPISFRDHAIATAQARLAEVAEALGIRDPITFVRFGTPADEIVQLGREIGADVIVMGAHGDGVVRRVFVDGVAERVVRMCERPVLVVPPAA